MYKLGDFSAKSRDCTVLFVIVDGLRFCGGSERGANEKYRVLNCSYWINDSSCLSWWTNNVHGRAVSVVAARLFPHGRLLQRETADGIVEYHYDTNLNLNFVMARDDVRFARVVRISFPHQPEHDLLLPNPTHPDGRRVSRLMPSHHKNRYRHHAGTFSYLVRVTAFRRVCRSRRVAVVLWLLHIRLSHTLESFSDDNRLHS